MSESRSGSTWLSFVLGTHDGCAHLGEYYRPFVFEGHIACRLCEAEGKEACDILYGIENIPADNAHSFAFRRTNADVIVDCSKDIPWLTKAATQQGFDIAVIHLLRDPRAWFASERRRVPMTPAEACARWVTRNQEIATAITDLHLNHRAVFYDGLCVDPHVHFAGICEMLNITFDPQALQYWRKRHHGLGGNGAAFNNIGDVTDNLITGDDAFYQANQKRLFHDRRWLDDLSAEDRKQIENDPRVLAYLETLGTGFATLDQFL
ncbi:MAG: hypothetical protein AAFZ04_03200 [Pseudomonadota bacterium]